MAFKMTFHTFKGLWRENQREISMGLVKDWISFVVYNSKPTKYKACTYVQVQSRAWHWSEYERNCLNMCSLAGVVYFSEQFHLEIESWETNFVDNIFISRYLAVSRPVNWEHFSPRAGPESETKSIWGYEYSDKARQVLSSYGPLFVPEPGLKKRS